MKIFEAITKRQTLDSTIVEMSLHGKDSRAQENYDNTASIAEQMMKVMKQSGAECVQEHLKIR